MRIYSLGFYGVLRIFIWTSLVSKKNTPTNIFSQPIINILTSNAHARRCEGCSQMKRHYARNRCQQCYQRFVSYCRRNGLVIRDQPIPKE